MIITLKNYIKIAEGVNNINELESNNIKKKLIKGKFSVKNKFKLLTKTKYKKKFIKNNNKNTKKNQKNSNNKFIKVRNT